MYIRRKTIFFCIVMLIVNCNWHVMAHEMYYTSAGIGINLKRSDLSDGAAYLKINGSYLSGTYTSYYATAINAWSNASDRVRTVNVSFSNSNVDIATASESYWINKYGDAAYDTVGYTANTTTDGRVLNASNAAGSSKKIRHSSILMSPFQTDIAWIRYGMIHELGHSLGLGHPNAQYDTSNDPSVMRTNITEVSYYTPRQHDINDLRNKYS